MYESPTDERAVRNSRNRLKAAISGQGFCKCNSSPQGSSLGMSAKQTDWSEWLANRTLRPLEAYDPSLLSQCQTPASSSKADGIDRIDIN